MNHLQRRAAFEEGQARASLTSHFDNIGTVYNKPRTLEMTMTGKWTYGLVWQTVIDGENFEEPYDDRVFNSIHKCRDALREAKREVQA